MTAIVYFGEMLVVSIFAIVLLVISPLGSRARLCDCQRTPPPRSLSKKKLRASRPPASIDSSPIATPFKRGDHSPAFPSIPRYSRPGRRRTREIAEVAREPCRMHRWISVGCVSHQLIERERKFKMFIPTNVLSSPHDSTIGLRTVGMAAITGSAEPQFVAAFLGRTVAAALV
jgi:hypothetical protein